MSRPLPLPCPFLYAPEFSWVVCSIKTRCMPWSVEKSKSRRCHCWLGGRGVHHTSSLRLSTKLGIFHQNHSFPWCSCHTWESFVMADVLLASYLVTLNSFFLPGHLLTPTAEGQPNLVLPGGISGMAFAQDTWVCTSDITGPSR